MGGCATKGDIRALQTEVREELRAQSARQDSLLTMLTRATASTQDTLRTQSDQLFDFRGDITRLLQSLNQGMTRLEAVTGENQRGIAQLRAQLGRGGPAPVVVPGMPTDSSQATSETLSGVGGGNADQLYNVARDQQSRGSLSAAQQAYEQFLQDYPNDARAPDARFFLADLLWQQNRPDDALEAFQEIPARHPTAARVPDALYRIARIQVDMGDPAAARATAQRIVNTYPDTTWAILARDLLDELE
jgi:tol-pal system protein YbgF